jgi:hypothetical protein
LGQALCGKVRKQYKQTNNNKTHTHTHTQEEKIVKPLKRFLIFSTLFSNVSSFFFRSSVKWQEFREKFYQDYSSAMDQEFGDVSEERKKLLANLMHKEVFRSSTVVRQSTFEEFAALRKKGAHRFYRAMQDYVVAYESLRDIFSMDSSVRIATIQSLGEVLLFFFYSLLLVTQY